MSGPKIKKIGTIAPFTWETLLGEGSDPEFEKKHTWVLPTREDWDQFSIWNGQYQRARAELDAIEREGVRERWLHRGYSETDDMISEPSGRWVKKETEEED